MFKVLTKGVVWMPGTEIAGKAKCLQAALFVAEQVVAASLVNQVAGTVRVIEAGS